ncbi:MAG: hypothetical protein DU429_03805 [Candidatus Tokpelaia sp.]|uniref:hypothetical protein n=1 Tax=Candidatus Tokpelaia sp. TaxID=2233777 RepID=UPI001238E2B6|nr:hypothetical protein [Candidatus Tokpelaia sp.]KAA6204733.1 MAG: hypothetical protein DU430_07630 [Candidatus Tokpelaia sp.]KAA6207221.1 MAG: hypothetical protein DU429_03805 [Candidatus Tokpelaia sp.]KAA6405280.1 hypothetical protein DPQ22_05305 [Candidatus Tokpelaia sp.]
MAIADKILDMRKNPSLENVRKEAERLRRLSEQQSGGRIPKPEHTSYDLARKFAPPPPGISVFKPKLRKFGSL